MDWCRAACRDSCCVLWCLNQPFVSFVSQLISQGRRSISSNTRRKIVLHIYFDDILTTSSIQTIRSNHEQESVIQYSKALIRFNSSRLSRDFSHKSTHNNYKRRLNYGCGLPATRSHSLWYSRYDLSSFYWVDYGKSGDHGLFGALPIDHVYAAAWMAEVFYKLRKSNELVRWTSLCDSRELVFSRLILH